MLENQLDLFIADFVDVTPKGEMTTMEHPIFSLSTKPDLEVFRYEFKDQFLEVIPSGKGRATIFDKDLLLYCIGQLKKGEISGREPSRAVKITSYDFLKSTGRHTGGRQYKLLADSLVRLRGTTFRTDILDKGRRKARIFGLIEEGKIAERDSDGRFMDLIVVLPEWLHEAVSENRILAYNRDYFSLRQPNQRRMYELCRKHCGNQDVWHISFNRLYEKFGTRASKYEFKRSLKSMVEAQKIPDYQLELVDDVVFVTQK